MPVKCAQRHASARMGVHRQALQTIKKGCRVWPTCPLGFRRRRQLTLSDMILGLTLRVEPHGRDPVPPAPDTPAWGHSSDVPVWRDGDQPKERDGSRACKGKPGLFFSDLRLMVPPPVPLVPPDRRLAPSQCLPFGVLQRRYRSVIRVFQLCHFPSTLPHWPSSARFGHDPARRGIMIVI
jgi:hypothetical protein